ncbi:unnamed protein product, partial [Owenia fusiformis]
FSKISQLQGAVRFSVYTALRKQTLKKIKGKKLSSQEWLTRQINDPYAKRARQESYRCRSAFKLLEIDDRFGVLKTGDILVDCGAAPGSWTQVAVERTISAQTGEDCSTGKVIAVDIQRMGPIEGATVLSQSDFTTPKTQKKILDLLGGNLVGSVISDMAPKATGIKSLDHECIIELCRAALTFSTKVLKPGGTFLCKIWMGAEQSLLEEEIRKHFVTLHKVKPPASRGDSAELFLLGRQFKGHR